MLDELSVGALAAPGLDVSSPSDEESSIASVGCPVFPWWLLTTVLFPLADSFESVSGSVCDGDVGRSEAWVGWIASSVDVCSLVGCGGCVVMFSVIGVSSDGAVVAVVLERVRLAIGETISSRYCEDCDGPGVRLVRGRLDGERVLSWSESENTRG